MKKIISLLIGIMLIAQVVYGASFTITIPDNLVSELLEAFATNFNYQETIPNPDYGPEDPESPAEIPNPVSKAGFARQHIRRFIRDQYLVYKANQAVEDAKNTAIDGAQTDTENVLVE